jgi:hypothetical protein
MWPLLDSSGRQYYVDRETDEVADELWKVHSSAGNTPPKCDNSSGEAVADDTAESY